jgi:hypothetical protein
VNGRFQAHNCHLIAYILRHAHDAHTTRSASVPRVMDRYSRLLCDIRGGRISLFVEIKQPAFSR